ncbi:transposase is4 [Holotrichia oblita]|uniref:Transposase is4 n=1 Tax=Holotrichia oblita TaxID=644536 RepID=A0ACB9TRR7_HOLOL|nr:transposase is4 [Holotrichia oblita]
MAKGGRKGTMDKEADKKVKAVDRQEATVRLLDNCSLGIAVFAPKHLSDDKAEQTFFECPNWNEQRTQTERRVWCLNTSDGYLVDLDVHQGKNPNAVPEFEERFGKNAAPFDSMLENLPNPKLSYKFYLDNLFTSVTLFNFLRVNGYGGTGTFREDRIPLSCPLASKKDLKKKGERGSSVSALEKTHGILFVKWTDNNVVTVGSTCHGVAPIANVRRYSQAEKKYVQVTRPSLVGSYNNYMGGTDLMDENIACYRIGIR